MSPEQNVNVYYIFHFELSNTITPLCRLIRKQKSMQSSYMFSQYRSEINYSKPPSSESHSAYSV